jgi:hypothetical protein
MISHVEMLERGEGMRCDGTDCGRECKNCLFRLLGSNLLTDIRLFRIRIHEEF